MLRRAVGRQPTTSDDYATIKRNISKRFQTLVRVGPATAPDAGLRPAARRARQGPQGEPSGVSPRPATLAPPKSVNNSTDSRRRRVGPATAPHAGLRPAARRARQPPRRAVGRQPTTSDDRATIKRKYLQAIPDAGGLVQQRPLARAYALRLAAARQGCQRRAVGRQPTTSDACATIKRKYLQPIPDARRAGPATAPRAGLRPAARRQLARGRQASRRASAHDQRRLAQPKA